GGRRRGHRLRHRRRLQRQRLAPAGLELRIVLGVVVDLGLELVVVPRQVARVVPPGLRARGHGGRRRRGDRRHLLRGAHGGRRRRRLRRGADRGHRLRAARGERRRRGERGLAAGRARRALGRGRLELAIALELRRLVLDLLAERLLHPPREILARVELAGGVDERLELVVEIDRVLVAILGVLRERDR